MKILKYYKISTIHIITSTFKFTKYILLGFKYIFFSIPLTLIYKITNTKKKIPNIILLLSLASYLLCIFLLSRWYVQNQRTKKFAESISNQQEIIIYNNNSTNKIQTDEYQDQTIQIDNSTINNNLNNNNNIYNDNYINVNLDYYINKNNDTVGWIQIDGTNINYPIVQAKDNDYYLKRDFYKKKSDTGWIFLDYRNNLEKLDNNTILYGHNLINKTMFGNLPSFLKNNWLEKKEKPYIKLSTIKHNSIWQIFSVYKTKPTIDYLETKFYALDTYINFQNKIKDRSKKDFNIELFATDKIITLSTCDDTGKYRVVIHAKLLKIENK